MYDVSVLEKPYMISELSRDEGTKIQKHRRKVKEFQHDTTFSLLLYEKKVFRHHQWNITLKIHLFLPPYDLNIQILFNINSTNTMMMEISNIITPFRMSFWVYKLTIARNLPALDSPSRRFFKTMLFLLLTLSCFLISALDHTSSPLLSLCI